MTRACGHWSSGTPAIFMRVSVQHVGVEPVSGSDRLRRWRTGRTRTRSDDVTGAAPDSGARIRLAPARSAPRQRPHHARRPAGPGTASPVPGVQSVDDDQRVVVTGDGPGALAEPEDLHLARAVRLHPDRRIASGRRAAAAVRAAVASPALSTTVSPPQVESRLRAPLRSGRYGGRCPRSTRNRPDLDRRRHSLPIPR